MSGIISNNIGRSSGLLKSAAGGSVKTFAYSEDTTDRTTTSTTFTTAGPTITISGVTSGNDVIIIGAFKAGHSAAGWDVYLELRRGTTSFLQSGENAHALLQSPVQYGCAYDGEALMLVFQCKDDGHSGGDITYNLYWKTNSGTAKLNTASDTGLFDCAGTLTAWEIS